MSFRAIFLFLLVSSSLASLVLIQASSSGALVTMTATNNGMTTTLQFTNNAENISDISSLILQIGQGGNFKSFKTDSGWVGIRNSVNILTFTSTNPIKPGHSANFVVKTDQSNPVIAWKALDDKNNDLGSGEIGTPQTGTFNQTVSKPPTSSIGISDSSNFRIIPSTPKAGSDVRVIGLSFAPTTNLDLYIGNNKIDSFSTNENGNFIITTKIPDNQPIGSVSLFVKDQSGNSKTFSTIIHEASNRTIITIQRMPLTVKCDTIYHRGDTKTINGTGTPGSTLTILVQDSKGNGVTTFTATADKTGHYSYTTTVPIDAPFGDYTINVSDGKNKASCSHNIVTSHQIVISMSQEKIDPGQALIINGTSISNQLVSFSIIDPTGKQVFAKDVNVTSDGKIAIAYSSDAAAVKGTYIATVSQGTDQVTVYFGVGELPVPKLTISMDKLDYTNADKPQINISGPPTSKLNLVIVDPSGKQKFADLVLVGPDGFVTYSFNVTSYNPGIYTAVINRGNDKASADFQVGVPTDCGQITMKTIKEFYLLGDNIIIVGNTKNANCLVRLTLTDPQGVVVKSEQVFTDKKGFFSITDFRIPIDEAAGIWKLDATNALNHFSLDLTIKSGHEGITMMLDRNPPVYNRGDIITISGTGAGKEADVIINVIGTNNTKALSLSISSTNTSDFSTLWKIPLNFNPGSYTIQAKSVTGQATTNISVQ